MEYPIEYEGKKVGSFRLDPFPGCSKICISHHLEINPTYRGRGIGTKAQADRLDLARRLGFKVILATVVGSNVRQERILTGAGWRRATFYEKEGDTVHLWIRNLSDPYEEAEFFQGGCR